MADVKISALPASAGLATVDLIPVVDDPGGVPVTQKATIAQLITLLDTIYAPITGGAYVLKAGDTMTGLLTITQAAANTAVLTSTGYSLTGANAQSLMSLSGTWNTTGAPTALRLSIVNTASAATSKLVDILGGPAGATSLFSVTASETVAANLYIPGAITSVNNVTFAGWWIEGQGATAGIGFGSGHKLVWAAAATNTNTAIVGDTGLGRNAAGIVEVNNATAGTFGDLYARILRTATAFTVATLPAAGVAGRMAYVTDATAPTYLGALVGGGAVVCPVFDNGAAWVST